MGTTVAEIRGMLKAANAEEFAALERSLAADSRKGVVAALEAARRRLAAEASERERIEALYAFDLASIGEGGGVVIGLDEVGRGAVAGPLAVGAVALRYGEGERIADLNDSKQLSPEKREVVAAAVKNSAIGWAVCYIDPQDIDSQGMSASLREAFKGALGEVEAQGVKADVVLVDGNPLGIDARERNVVKGDATSAAIAAESVVAKVERDALMCKLSSAFPQYRFSDNKGYAAPDHIEAIRAYGLTSVHRASFCRSFMQESLF